ncbi:MAG: MotA/TolQ/ExbB proton channel family protein [Methylococcaceae bacterium]|nr:MotA/TolQ/ExbB proton channel family protein [Methylococcaceae bacterium]MCI0667785.1 MotA/TolQ/ExbB proton channel family protein [Methylococcaceae bacterium]MCI0732434.1 MotA/TolQ/ExbB proton channel family protein [Methylococcaceae bacterium]
MDALFFLIGDLMAAGGSVMWGIALISLVLWFLIIERFFYIRVVYPADRKAWLARWNARTAKHSWPAHAIRNCTIARARAQLSRNLKIIRMLIALCPMLGLLGTVAGMIQTFDVMAAMGTGNARAMASGISAATITTMAGLVIAISSLYFSKWIEDRVERETRSLADLLTFH